MRTYDLIVLGGGAAAALAARAGSEGWKTALVEAGALGGTCPNRGCIPSKFLLEHATRVRRVREAHRFHMDVRVGRIDSGAIFSEMRAHIARSSRKIRESLGRRVALYPVRGTFLDAHTIRAGSEVLRAPRIVIATGMRPSRPLELDPGRIPYWVSDDLFSLKKVPSSMVIVGGGFVACEFAHFFSALGTRVTVVERSSGLLPGEDGDIRTAFQEAFAPRIDLRVRASVAAVEHRAGRFTVRLAGGRGGTVSARTLLYAIGRTPNTDGIGLEKTGIPLDRRGFIRVNGRLETGVRGVYALGDVNGRHPFTHAATFQRKYLAERFFEGRRTLIDPGAIPHAVFTDPEIGSVGETEEALRDRGARYVASLVRFDEVAKGRAMRAEHGLAKLLVGLDGSILGFHVVGPEASILLHQVTPLMRWRKHVTSLTRTVTVHPSLSEVVARTAEGALEKLSRLR